MDRDQYLMFKTEHEKYMARIEIAKSIVDKIDKTYIDDLNLLPAIDHWLNTGDETFFEEYYAYHFSKTTEQRRKETERLLIKIEEEKEDMEAEIKEARESEEQLKEILKKCMSAYDEYVASYKKYLKEMTSWRKSVPTGVPTEEAMNVSKIISAIEKICTGENPKAWKQKRLYVYEDKKLKSVKSVELSSDDKIILCLEKEGFMVNDRPTPPPYPSELDKYAYYRNWNL